MTEGASDVLAPADTTSPVARRSLWSRFSSKSPVILALLALVLGFLIGALVIIFSTNTVLDAWRGMFHSWGAPGHALKVTFDNVGAAYRAMFTGSVIDPPQFWHSLTTGKQWSDSLTPISETLTYATPLVIASIAVGIAFQTGVFNIGANGQAIMGGIAGAAVGSMVNMPVIVHLPLTMACGIVGGMVAGAIPGFLKAFTGAHEVIVTLMLNYVIAFFLVFVLLSTSFQLPGQSNDISRTMYSSAQLAPLFGTASGLRVSYGVLIAAAVVLFAWWFLDRSSLGFDFRITGNNPHAARASGINARRIVVLVFLISGGLAGLAGVVQVASTTHYVDGNFLIGSAGIGFTAITVALLGRNRPMGIVWGSLLFAALGVGGRNMQAATGIPLDLATIIQSVVVLFVATPVLVKEIFRLRSTSANAVHLATQGWSS
ncbi:MAG: ABC transporter permease [Acidimicrobiales bacterium]